MDDEEGVRKLVLAVLQSNGYDVLEASNGVAALAAYEKNAHKIDMVLTDVVMPQMTGFELGANWPKVARAEDPLHVGISRQSLGRRGNAGRSCTSRSRRTCCCPRSGKCWTRRPFSLAAR